MSPDNRGQEVRSTSCSYKDQGLVSNTHTVTQPCVTPFPEDLISSSGLSQTRYVHDVQIYMLAKTLPHNNRK